MIYLNKNKEAILKVRREQIIAKKRNRRINKTIIKKFDIKSSRISLISNMLMGEEHM